MISHPSVMGIASNSRHLLQPILLEILPAGKAPMSAPITYMETIHDDCSMVTGMNKVSPMATGVSGAVHPATTVPEANDMMEATEKKTNKLKLK